MANLAPGSPPSRTSPTNDPDNAAVAKSSRFKGVHWDKTKAKWVGYIHVQGKKHHLGYFAAEEDAARAYDRESLRCRGVTKNFPSSEYDPSELSQAPEARKVLEKSSRYIGVSWNKLRRKWAARIIVDGRSLHLGHYAQEADAARAYDKVCLKSRGVTKNFPAEQYADLPSARKLPAAGDETSAGKFVSHHQMPQLALHHGRSSFGNNSQHRNDTDDNSQDSTTCSDPLRGLQDGQPRLFVSSREYSGFGSLSTEPLSYSNSTAQNAQPAYNSYSGLSPPKPPPVSASNWSQPTMTAGPPTQFMGYSGGFNSLLPLGPMQHSPRSQAPVPSHSGSGSGFFFPQSSQGAAIHGVGSYNSVQPVMPSSLLAGQPLPLPAMLQMHPKSASSVSGMGQLAPGSHQIATQAGMAQLQAWAAIQNSMYGPSAGMYQTDKQLDRLEMGPPMKRPRFDTLVQS